MIDRRSLEIRHRKGLWLCRDCWMLDKDQLTPRAIGRAGTTPANSSSSLSGNLRRRLKGWEALTLQEQRAIQPEEYR